MFMKAFSFHKTFSAANIGLIFPFIKKLKSFFFEILKLIDKYAA